MSLVDLRRVNLVTEEDVLDFIELMVRKLPKAQDIIKKQRMSIISLQNQLNFERSKNRNGDVAQYQDENASVLDRMASSPVKPAGPDRLEQLRNAQTPASPEDIKPISSVIAQAAGPGQIGQLNVPTADPTLPPVNSTPPEVEQELVIIDEPTEPTENTETEEAIKARDARPVETAAQEADVPTAPAPVKKSLKKK